MALPVQAFLRQPHRRAFLSGAAERNQAGQAQARLFLVLMPSPLDYKGFDPQAMEAVKKEIPDLVLCENPYAVAEDADALLLATEWNEFKSLDFKRVKNNMRGNVILDGRNIWYGKDLHKLGFDYYGVGVPKLED